MQSLNKWFLVRVGCFALSFWNGFNTRIPSTHPSSGVGTLYSHSDTALRDWGICGIICLGTAVLACCAVAVGYIARGRHARWTRPTWRHNPFNITSQPLQAPHLVAFLIIGEGLGGVLRQLRAVQYRGIPAPNISVVNLSIGVGLWAGLRLAVLLCQQKHGSLAEDS